MCVSFQQRSARLAVFTFFVRMFSYVPLLGRLPLTLCTCLALLHVGGFCRFFRANLLDG